MEATNKLRSTMNFADYVSCCVRGMKNCDKWVVDRKYRFMLTLNPKSKLPDGIDDYNDQLQKLKKVFRPIFEKNAVPPCFRFIVEFGDKDRLHWHIQVDLGTKRNYYTFWKCIISRITDEYFYKISKYHFYLDEYLKKEELPEWIHLNPIDGYESLDEATVFFDPTNWEPSVTTEGS